MAIVIITTILESIDTDLIDTTDPMNKETVIDKHVRHVITNSVVAWFYDDEFHCLDGPAVITLVGITADDEIIEEREWWYHGTKIECSSQEEFEKIIKMKVFW